jgi:glyoxylase-like metal-dependent hydrolase (beta-lactamase superfamily II)
MTSNTNVWAWGGAHALAVAAISLTSSLGCAAAPPPRPLTAQPLQESLLEAATWPNAAEATVVLAGQHFLATRRHREGHDFFVRRYAVTHADLDLALAGLLAAKMADQVPLLSRVAWVDEAVATLDRANARGAVLPRYLRALTLAGLPARFGAFDRAKGELDALMKLRDAFPFDPTRGLYRAYADAHRNAGKEAEAERWLRAAGAKTVDDPVVLDGQSIDGRDGFRFTSAHLGAPAPNVLVAEGYDFSTLVFVRTSAGVVSIDAGTRIANATRALADVQHRWGVEGPVAAVLFTHAHWDHVGGFPALAAPDQTVVSSASFVAQLEETNGKPAPFAWFFGDERWKPITVRPTLTVSDRGATTIGDTTFELYTVPGGETEGALMAYEPKERVAFLGDAFMPYFGAPTEPEGSPEGLLLTIERVMALHPKTLVHGHTPLNRFFTVAALPGLGGALGELRNELDGALARGEPERTFLGRGLLPRSLREAPESVIPYLVMREGFVDRYYRRHAGYWRRDGEIDKLADKDEAAVLELVAGGSVSTLTGAIERLLASGDYTAARRLAHLARLSHPNDPKLSALERDALSHLREQVHLLDPFRFIVYSQSSGQALPPVMNETPAR